MVENLSALAAANYSHPKFRTLQCSPSFHTASWTANSCLFLPHLLNAFPLDYVFPVKKKPGRKKERKMNTFVGNHKKKRFETLRKNWKGELNKIRILRKGCWQNRPMNLFNSVLLFLFDKICRWWGNKPYVSFRKLAILSMKFAPVKTPFLRTKIYT